MYVIVCTYTSILYFLKSVRGSNHITYCICQGEKGCAIFLSFLNDMFSLKFSGRYHLQKVAAVHSAVVQRTALLEVVLLVDTRQC